jgi:type IV pilus secretin PilQ/predicted competence protein
MKTIWPAFGSGCLLLAGAAICVLPANAQMALETAGAAAAPVGSISAVDVAHSGEQTVVHITGTGALHFQTSRLDSPSRIVLDFAETHLNVVRHKVASEYAPVMDVRVGQPIPGQSRVVIDLDKLVPFTTQSDESGVSVSFATTEGPVVPAALHPTKHPASQKLAAVRAPNMPLPAWLTGKDLGFASPANGPAAPEGQNPAPVTPPAGAPTSADKKYTGDPISVNLKDVDLKDFFRLIHEISGLNVVLDPSVRGTVTLVLDEVPWDQGLDIVLRNNGLSKEIDGNVLRITTQETLRHEADQRRDLLRAETDAVEPVTVTRVLSYAQANLMMPTVKKFLTARGDAIADQRSNTLIIRDIPAQIPKIDSLLRQLDRKSQQVEIEARVVQASRSFARQIGTQLAFSFGAGNNVFGGNQAVGTSPISRLVTPGAFTSPALVAGTPPSPPAAGGVAPAPVPVQMPLATNLPAGGATSGLTYLFSSPNFALDFFLSLMESRGVGKILSEPKGITQNNEKLTVKQGAQVPISTSINNTVSVQYVDAVLKLEVTPQITAEGTVFLDITVENTQIDPGISVLGQPGLDTQSTQTKVLVNDGGTVAIGGVIVNNQRTNIDQVPLLGSMPLIGNLFKHTSVTVTSQELLFFVTPRILPG